MAHVARIVIVGEREVMAGVQPAVVGVAEFCKRFNFDHGLFPLANVLVGIGRGRARCVVNCCRQAPKPPSTLSTVPVTKDASGLARNATPAATSSGRPKRCKACSLRWVSAKSPPS